jgi:hypothetical protein
VSLALGARMLVVATLALGGKSRAAVPPAARAHVGTWVWDAATVLAADARRDLLAFARNEGIDTLFVHASAPFDQDAGFEALAALVSAASHQGVSITLVGGDPSWTLPLHRPHAVAVVARVGRIEVARAARRLPTSGRVLFDVEPYLLPEWRSAHDRTVAAYVDLLRTVRGAASAASLEVWHTIPFWFPEQSLAGEPLDQLVLDQSAGVVLMAYRNREADVRGLSAPLLAQAAKRHRPVIVAVETMCIEPPRVTFCGQTTAELASALDHLAVALRGSPAFAGLAVHHYASWRTLGQHVR